MAKQRSEAAEAALERIGKLAGTVVEAAERGASPALDIPVRSLSNVSFSEERQIVEMGDRTQRRSFFNLNMAKRFMQTMLVAAECKKLLSQKKTTSIRDLFYMVKHTIPGTSEETFVDQGSESDPCIESM